MYGDIIDALRRKATAEALTSGDLAPAVMVSSGRGNLTERGIADGSVVDWLVWRDNSFLEDVLAEPFARLAAVAVRLGYPQD